MHFPRLRDLLSRHYLLFAVVLITCAGVLCYTLLATRSNVEKTDGLVAHTHNVINIAEQLGALKEAMLAAQRGFILTGDPSFLEKYEQAKRRMSENLATLTDLTAGNKSQQSRLDEARNYFVIFSNRLEERATRFHPNPIPDLVDGVAIIDDLRDNLTRLNEGILDEEHQLLAKRVARLEYEKQEYVYTLVAAIIGVVVLLLIFNAFLLSAHEGRSQAEESLKESQERFALAMEGTRDGIFDWNIQQQKIYFSDQFFRMLGYDLPPHPSLENFLDMLHPEDRERSWASISAEATSRPEYVQEFRLRHLSGRWIWIQARGKILFDQKLHPIRVVGAHTDISHVVQAAERLQVEMEMAQKANRAKSEFLAHMSHEIRTPLTAIGGIAEVLDRQRHTLSDRQQKLVHSLVLSSASLKDLISDVLDFSKIESGDIELNKEIFRLDGFFEEIVSMMSLKANEKGISFLCDYSELGQKPFYGDRGRIRQICVNLIGNAIKFTEQGKVSISATEEERDQQRYLRVDVSDTGIGISPNDFDLVFERFKQVNTSESRKYGGTGLGLPISQKLATLMGGTISISSRLGLGSTFSLLIPFTLVAEPVQSETSLATSLHLNAQIQALVTENTRVLLVEDYAGNIVLVSYLLEELGIPYDVATTGAQAVACWQQQHYSVMLMDIQMPEMDGFEATLAIRHAEQAQERPRTPIIGMTAHALIGDKDRCIQVGMDAYLPKPIVEIDLKRALLRYLQQQPPALASA